MARRIVPTARPASPVLGSLADLGRQVRHARTHALERIDVAAVRCGVSVQLLSDLEGGKRSVGFDNALKVAESFGLTFVLLPTRQVTALLGANLEGVLP